MSAVTGVLFLTMVILLFALSPWKKSSDDSSLKNAGEGTQASISETSGSEVKDSSVPEISPSSTPR